jgi:two-component system, NtrC family, nitrogen regulation sensor histidine kinase NtrY
VRLALRLALTFGLLAAASSVLVGLAVRTRLAAAETTRFQRDVEGVCERLVSEVKRQGDADSALINGACSRGELVERAGFALDLGEIEDRRTAYSQIVHAEREAFGLDELLLATERGEVLGASPLALAATPSAQVDALIRSDATRFSIRTAPSPALVSRCAHKTSKGHLVGMVGARHVDPMLERLAKTLDVTVVPSWPRAPTAASTPAKKDKKPTASASAPPSASAAPLFGAERATCKLDDGRGSAVSFDVLKPTKELEENLAEVDRTVGIAAIIAAVVAFLVAVLLARSVSRPLSVLATEAGKVAAGEARPLQVRGSGEVRELGAAFDKMIHDLAMTRRRLAAASRVAAWREVARRVAHEVKNPLAPIRAAVETLRRLRAREDPRFDEYFDEATRTVLDEVHRISNIVTEFTRFARLPSPRPQEMDVEEVARHVVQVHKAAAGDDVVLGCATQRRAPAIRADRDQVIQVLTNLVQNALDAVKGQPGAAVTVTTDTDGHYVSFSVIDNGPGIAPEIAGRLFEPYATTKATGTGLGLAIAQRIAYEHNGELAYIGRAANGRGAVFRLVLPVEGPPPMSETPPPPSSGDQ